MHLRVWILEIINYIFFYLNRFLKWLNRAMNRPGALRSSSSCFVGCNGPVPDSSSGPVLFAASIVADGGDAVADRRLSDLHGERQRSTRPIAFFQSLGTNGRACVHCHQAQDGWTITPAHVQARFNATTPRGTDPVFRTNDGSNSPLADVSTEAARQAAYSMLLSKGLIRVGIGMPANAEFELVAVDDPYGYASAAELSLFRRPLPSTNLRFLTTVMWDGRETFPTPDHHLRSRRSGQRRHARPRAGDGGARRHRAAVGDRGASRRRCSPPRPPTTTPAT